MFLRVIDAPHTFMQMNSIKATNIIHQKLIFEWNHVVAAFKRFLSYQWDFRVAGVALKNTNKK